MTATTIERVRLPRPAAAHIPLQRLVRVELRKMFDTRSGFWLVASIGIVAVLTAAGVVAFARGAVTYSTYISAIRIPVSLILPLVAILSVTSEWTQRTALTTFTLVARRSRVIAAKAVACVIVGVSSMLVVFAVSAVGNVVGSLVHGGPVVWDAAPVESLFVVLGGVLDLVTGFMLGLVIRASAGAISAYLVYSVIFPMLFGLAATQSWFRDVQPWVDVIDAQRHLFLMQGALSGAEWAHLAVTGLVWLVLPLAVGLHLVRRSEIK